MAEEFTDNLRKLGEKALSRVVLRGIRFQYFLK